MIVRTGFPDHYSGLVAACVANGSDAAGWGGAGCASAMLHTSGPRILALGLDLDRLLATDRHFARLRGWIDSARAFGADGAERDWLEYNARLQITLWGSVEANHALLAGCKPAFSHPVSGYS